MKKIFALALVFSMAVGMCSFAGEVTSYEDVKQGDVITFGSYEQDNDTENGSEAIEWSVLDVTDGKALLVSSTALDCKPYNNDWTEISWETSSIRSWLNDDFLSEAFTEDEASRIAVTEVKDSDNSVSGISGGNSTQDKIFLLSLAEVEKYFDADPGDSSTEYSALECKASDYAAASGTWVNSESGHEGSCIWWLRSPGSAANMTTVVMSSGTLNTGGYPCYLTNNAVRPAMWIYTDDDYEEEVNAQTSAGEETSTEGETSGTAQEVQGQDEPLTAALREIDDIVIQETQAQNGYKAQVYGTYNSGLSLKSGASDSSASYFVMPEGTDLVIDDMTAASDGTRWGHTEYNGQEGWVMLRYIKLLDDCEAVEPMSSSMISTANYTVYNTEGEGLEFRTGPAVYYPTFGPVYDGTTVQVTAIENSWAYVTYNGHTGWLHTAYLYRR